VLKILYCITIRRRARSYQQASLEELARTEDRVSRTALEPSAVKAVCPLVKVDKDDVPMDEDEDENERVQVEESTKSDAIDGVAYHNLGNRSRSTSSARTAQSTSTFDPHDE
jgi:hypothetical protein